MAMARSIVLKMIPPCCSSARTSIRTILVRAARRSEGRGAGEGFTINVPMEAGEGDEEYRAVFQKSLVPAADAFKPEFVIISAGFDAHKDDPLASMGLTEEGYADLTDIVAGIAKRHAGGRMLSSLEGGYQSDRLGRLGRSPHSGALSRMKNVCQRAKAISSQRSVGWSRCQGWN